VIEFAYHWSPEHPRRKVHLSIDDCTALCGRDVSDVAIETVAPLRPVIINSAVASEIITFLPICFQCYKRAYKTELAK